MRIMGDIAAQLRAGARGHGKELPMPKDRRSRRARARAQDRALRTDGQRRWRKTFGGIVTVADARGLSEIDARTRNQRKGARRRRARAAARRQMMPAALRYDSRARG